MTTNDILKDYIIYKIYCKNKEITYEYYGHTSAFRNRKYLHKSCCINENDRDYNTDKYKFIRLNGGWSNWDMVPIEELKNCSLVNAKIREQFHIDLNKSLMNKNKSYITEEQIKEQILEYQKDYRLKNRDKIVEKKKEHYLENRDKILEKANEYHLENRNKILEKNKEKITCMCGKTFTKQAKSQHERTQFHCKFIQLAM